MTEPAWPWNTPCSLMGCPRKTKPHHHHYLHGHLDTRPCTCPEIDQPGTAVNW